MKIDVPSYISELPTKEYWKSVYPNEKWRSRIAYLVALKVYRRTIVSEQQNHRCCYCGIRTTEVQGFKYSATVEHIIPKSQGGPDDLDNYALACYKCNNDRGDKPLEQYLRERDQRVITASLKVKLLQELREAGYKITNTTTCHSSANKLQRKLDAIEVKKVVAAGEPNKYEEGTRKHKMYVRFTNNGFEDQRPMKEAA